VSDNICFSKYCVFNELPVTIHKFTGGYAIMSFGPTTAQATFHGTIDHLRALHTAIGEVLAAERECAA